jgi:uncharacterized SAM-binding protein YcdF (DUF218 family)
MFILSKILLFLLNPLFWICLAFLLSWIIKKPVWKKRLRITAVILLLIFSNPFLINKVLTDFETPKHQIAENEKYTVGILLGGFVGFDSKGEGYFNEASERVIQSLRLYKTGHIQKILMSGGSGTLLRQEFREADFTRDQLIKMGVNPADILIDRNSRNTYENAVYSKQILDSLGLTAPYLLITSAWHMPRATAVFRKAGLNIQPFPCDYKHSITSDPEDFIVPSATAMGRWSMVLKEWMGILVYKMTGKA